MYSDVQVSGNAQVYDDARVSGNALVFGNAQVSGNAKLRSTALVQSTKDHTAIGPIGSRNDYTTFAKSENGGILVFCGCFTGTLEEFETRVREVYRDDEYGRRYLQTINYAKIIID